MVKEIVSSFKVYPVIGLHSTEQTRFLRHDPMPYTEFEHIKRENERKEKWREIRHSLIAFGLLGLLIYWGFGL